MNIVWVPYDSKIKVDGIDYKVIRSKLSQEEGRRIGIQDQSVDCLKDSQDNLHSLYDLVEKNARVRRLSLLERIKKGLKGIRKVFLR